MIKTKSQYKYIHGSITGFGMGAAFAISNDVWTLALMFIASMCHLIFTEVVQPLFE